MENNNIPSADETVKIYDCKNNEVQLKFRHGPTKQLLAHEQNYSIKDLIFKAMVQGRLCKKDDRF